MCYQKNLQLVSMRPPSAPDTFQRLASTGPPNRGGAAEVLVSTSAPLWRLDGRDGLGTALFTIDTAGGVNLGYLSNLGYA